MDTIGPFSRREWLAVTLGLLAAGCASRGARDRTPVSSDGPGRIETSTGPLAAGFTDGEVQQLLVVNPRLALTRKPVSSRQAA